MGKVTYPAYPFGSKNPNIPTSAIIMLKMYKVLCAALPNRLVLVRDRAKHGYHVVQVLVHLVEQPLLFDLQGRLQIFGIVVQFALKYPAAARLVRRYFLVYVQHTLIIQERAFERVPPHRVVRVAQIEHFDRVAFVRKRFCVQGVQFALRIGDEHAASSPFISVSSSV